MAAGSQLGRYELLARIATGGMGEIFLARMEGAAGFEKLCVIKRILPHLADDSRFRAMLVAEARIASSMSHANVCHVYALEETNRQLYMVMEYLEGATLLQLLRAASRRRQQLATGFVAGVVQQVCEGLHYAHELRDRNGTSLGVVHRDVSPSNLFLTESGVVKLVDFGIAKVKSAAETEAREVKGKYAYMAPEQLRSQTIDRRADVFSLAVVVFEMLTCRRLFQRKTDFLTFRALMEQPVTELQEYRPDASDAVAAVLRRGLDRDPDHRYPTVRQFGAELVDALDVPRPWSQAEISELVRTEFARELGVHNTEVARVLGHSERASLQTIPLVAHPTSDSDASDYFSVDSYGSGRPANSSDISMLARRSNPRLDHAASVELSRVLEASEPERQGTARGRSNLGVMAAILGMAAVVLGVGLALVERGRTRPGAGAAVPTTASAPQSPPSEPYGVAIHGHDRELDQCARDHGGGLPPDARAVIMVGVDGRAKQIALQPDDADRSQLAACIRGVLRMVAFPTAPEDKEVAIGLVVTSAQR
jgi:serine/threonine-protein kinase